MLMDVNKCNRNRMISDYFLNFVQIHNIKNHRLGILVFLILLAVISFQRIEFYKLAVDYILGEKNINDFYFINEVGFFVIMIVTAIVTQLVSSIYLFSYIKDLKINKVVRVFNYGRQKKIKPSVPTLDRNHCEHRDITV